MKQTTKHGFLEKVILRKKTELLKLIEKKSLKELKEEVFALNKNELNVPRKFNFDSKHFFLIAEIKLSSPSEKKLGEKVEILKQTKRYEDAGADAISFITEHHFFKGDINKIRPIKNSCSLPVLMKDFVIDEYQIYEAKKAGADGILLIAKLVNTDLLNTFVDVASSIGIEPFVEVNDYEDLLKAKKTNTRIIAVNARNLDNLEININKASMLLKKIPSTYIKLGFSGISSNKQVIEYIKNGARGVLVGTNLMKAKNIDLFINDLRSLNSVKVKICGVRDAETAISAVKYGADYVGLNLIKESIRYISPEEALKIADKIRGRTKIVAVFQNHKISEVNRIAKLIKPDFIQMHGSEDNDYINKIKYPVIKSIADINLNNRYENNYLLIDRVVQGAGKMQDLNKSMNLAKIRKIFFAGGLTPENVCGIVRKVKPFAVDVSSGVETNGKKDIKKIKEFIYNAKGVLFK